MQGAPHEGSASIDPSPSELAEKVNSLINDGRERAREAYCGSAIGLDHRAWNSRACLPWVS